MPRPRLLGSLAAMALVPAAAAASSTQFYNFFPVYADVFTAIRDGPCATEWAAQQKDPSGVPDVSLHCTRLVECMLAHTPEYIKSNMANASVLLGLMPALLTFLSSAPAETALLARRRPLLAALLQVGAPAVNPVPTFVYPDPVAALRVQAGRYLPRRLAALTPRLALVVVVVEYALAAAAIANVFIICYYAGTWTGNTIGCSTTFNPLLWAAFALGVHVINVVALALQVETLRDEDADCGPRGWRERLGKRVREEFTPSIMHDKLQLRTREETPGFVFWSWLVSVLIVAYVVFGITAFSSLMFIGYVDSLKIVGRIMASAVVCRALLMFELAGMRNAVFKHHLTGGVHETPEVSRAPTSARTF